MSAFMVNNRTLTKIAKYMEACANYQIGKAPGLSELELKGNFKQYLQEQGLVDKTGMFSASLIHRYLFDKNRKAIVARYGEDERMMGMSLPMEDGGTAIDIAKETRKEWLANLYTVCRCYKYQIEEGDYQEDEFYWMFREWLVQMAAELAKYVVNEVRPYKVGEPHKSWEEF